MTVLRSKLKRIGDDVKHDTLCLTDVQHCFDDLLRSFKRKRYMTLFCQRGKRFCPFAHGFVHVHLAPLRLEHTAFILTEIQHLVDQTQQHLGVPMCQGRQSMLLLR